MEQNISQVDIKSLSKEQRAELLARLQQEEKDDRIARRDAYEALRGEFMHAVRGKAEALTEDVTGFKKWLEGETDSFTAVMKE